MTVTMKDIPAILNDLKKRKPATLTKDSDRSLSPKEAIIHLAPTLVKKREEGFTTIELVDFLANHRITVKPHNLTRYLREYSPSTAKAQSEPEKQAPNPPAPISKPTAHKTSLISNDPQQ